MGRVVLVLLALGLSPARLAIATEHYTSDAASVLIAGGSMMNGDHFADSTLEVMRQHYAGSRKIALVLHATHPNERGRMEARLQKAFEHLNGAAAESLHRHDAAGQMALLAAADGIFVGGGETFVLLGELHRTGQLELIRRRVEAGIPYGGSSAGANVAGLLIGTTNDFPVAEIPTRRALAIFPAVINPHHPPPAAKAEFEGRRGKIRIYLQFNPTETVVALGNASIVRWHGGRAVLATGDGWLYQSEGIRELKLNEPISELAP